MRVLSGRALRCSSVVIRIRGVRIERRVVTGIAFRTRAVTHILADLFPIRPAHRLERVKEIFRRNWLRSKHLLRQPLRAFPSHLELSLVECRAGGGKLVRKQKVDRRNQRLNAPAAAQKQLDRFNQLAVFDHHVCHAFESPSRAIHDRRRLFARNRRMHKIRGGEVVARQRIQILRLVRQKRYDLAFLRSRFFEYHQPWRQFRSQNAVAVHRTHHLDSLRRCAA